MRSTSIPPWIFGAWIAGFVLGMVTIFKPKVARITGVLYAVAEGLLLGAISHLFEVQYKGIVLQAVGAHDRRVRRHAVPVRHPRSSGHEQAPDRDHRRHRSGVPRLHGVDPAPLFVGVHVPFIHDAGPLGIVFSLVVVGIAAFNLLLDFDFVERGVAAGAPRYMEWYAAFGLLVTLVWLYLELLRLLAKLRQR